MTKPLLDNFSKALGALLEQTYQNNVVVTIYCEDKAHRDALAMMIADQAGVDITSAKVDEELPKFRENGVEFSWNVYYSPEKQTGILKIEGL